MCSSHKVIFDGKSKYSRENTHSFPLDMVDQIWLISWYQPVWIKLVGMVNIYWLILRLGNNPRRIWRQLFAVLIPILEAPEPLGSFALLLILADVHLIS
jgi:hypothetical protein